MNQINGTDTPRNALGDGLFHAVISDRGGGRGAKNIFIFWGEAAASGRPMENSGDAAVVWSRGLEG